MPAEEPEEELDAGEGVQAALSSVTDFHRLVENGEQNHVICQSAAEYHHRTPPSASAFIAHHITCHHRMHKCHHRTPSA